MTAVLWTCCRCCEGIALSDHVGHGGVVPQDGHDLPCRQCRTPPTEPDTSTQT